MKSLVKFIVALIFLSTAGTGFGQDCKIFDDYKEGSSVKMVHYDKKDKATGFTISTVKEKKKIPGGLSVVFHQKYSDYDEYAYEGEFDMRCENGDVYVDMAKFLDPNTLAAYENMEIEVVADDISIPSNAKAGDVLNDGAVTVTVNTGSPVKISITVTLSNRRIESFEKVETPAGSFECMKIAYDMLTQIGFVKIQASAIEYYTKDHGVIKTESYSKKGKLTAYSVVEEIIN